MCVTVDQEPIVMLKMLSRANVCKTIIDKSDGNYGVSYSVYQYVILI